MSIVPIAARSAPSAERCAIAAGLLSLSWAAGVMPAIAQSDSQPEIVVVTATRTATALGNAPQSISVISSEQIAATPAQGLDDILRDVPGMVLTNIGPDVGHPTAYNEGMRGLPTTETRMLVMVDGIPVNDPFFGYIQWNLVPLNDIERVEVVRGGGSPLWGNTAMGGVVNVITRTPAANQLDIAAGGGNYGSYDTSIFGTYVPNDWMTLRLDGAFQGTDGYQTTPATWTSFGTLNLRSPVYTPTSNAARNVGLRADFMPGDGLTGFVNFHYGADNQVLSTPIGVDTQELLTFDGGFTKTFDDETSLTGTYFHNDNHFITNNPHLLTFTTEYNSNEHVTTASDNGASLVLTHDMTDWVKSVGIGGDVHQITGHDVANYYAPAGGLAAPTIIGGGDQLFAAGFAQAKIVPVAPLQILGSIRYQYYLSSNGIDTFPPGFANIPDESKYRFTPRIDAKYMLDDGFAIRGAYYQSFRAPTLDQLYRTYADTAAGIYEGDPLLSPESLEGEEIGFDFTNSTIRSQFTLYNSTISNLITQRTLLSSEYPNILGVTCGYDQQTFTYLTCTRNINSASAVARGIEEELTWDMGSGFSSIWTYTYADSHYTSSPYDPTAVGERLEGVPMHNASASLSYTDSSGWHAAAVLRYISKSYGDAHPADGLIQNGHFTVDISGSYDLTEHLTAYTAIQNLFGTRYIATNGGGVPILGTPFEVMSGLRLRLE
jgi:outer membrane receptor protein involved in Fe transport